MKNRSKNNILNYLSAEEKEQFLDELLSAIKHSKKSANFGAIENCLEYWEEVAELNSIPNFKERVWERFNCLKSAGKVC